MSFACEIRRNKPVTGEELEALRERMGVDSKEAMAELLQFNPVGYRR